MMSRTGEEIEDEDSSSSGSSGGSDQEMDKNGGGGDGGGSSDDEDMDLEESQVVKKLEEINEKLLDEPYSYDLRVTQIGLLKSVGDLDKVRVARERMAEIYPLNKRLWLDWVRDEMALVSTPEEREAVKSLFERAVKDYLSIEIWAEYIQFTLGQLGDEVDGEGGNGSSLEDKIEDCRNLFERALSSCALHFTDGSVIWNSYRDFEASLVGLCGSDPVKERAQFERFESICKRHFKLPIKDVDKSWEEVRDKLNWDQGFQVEFRKTLDRVKELEIKENEIANCTDEGTKVGLYRSYIEEEIKRKAHPSVIQCLFERAIEEHPLYSTLWVDYINYLAKNLKVSDLIMGVGERAARNCSWDLNIWILYMTQAEKLFPEPSEAKERVKSIFEKALVYHPSGGGVPQLWLHYLEFLRRLIHYEQVNEEDLKLLFKTFEAAEAHLLQLFPEPNDSICQIVTFRLRVEANARKSMESTREKWKAFFARGYGAYARVWVQYLTLEIRFGSLKIARHALGKGMGFITDDPDGFGDYWMNFERDFGDLGSLESCRDRIGIVIGKKAEAEARKKAEKEAARAAAKARVGKGAKPGLGFKLGSDGSGGTGSRGIKRSAEESHNNRSSDEIQGKKAKTCPSTEKSRLFVKGVSFKLSESQLRDLFGKYGEIVGLRIPVKPNGQTKGILFVDYSDESAAAQAILKLDGTTHCGKTFSIAISNPPAKGAPGDATTAHEDKVHSSSEFKVPQAPPPGRGGGGGGSRGGSRGGYSRVPPPSSGAASQGITQRKRVGVFIPRAVQIKK